MEAHFTLSLCPRIADDFRLVYSPEGQSAFSASTPSTINFTTGIENVVRHDMYDFIGPSTRGKVQDREHPTYHPTYVTNSHISLDAVSSQYV